jgi:hypothetical protein
VEWLWSQLAPRRTASEIAGAAKAGSSSPPPERVGERGQIDRRPGAALDLEERFRGSTCGLSSGSTKTCSAAGRSFISIAVAASSTHVPMSPAIGGFAATIANPPASTVAPRALR